MRSILAVVNVLGALLALFAAYFLLPIATALIYGETAELRVFLQCAGARRWQSAWRCCCCTRRYRAELKPRDGYLLVSLSWLAVTARGGAAA